MTSAAQMAANQQNAKLSTGPRTAEGKQAASRNATKFGLFSAQNCVHAHEQEEYDQVNSGLLQELTPVGNVETMFATEVIRCSWRLRRCAVAEGQLGDQTEESGLDPSIVTGLDKQQAAIDRARASAQNGLRRAFISLSNRQNQRVIKEQTCVRIDVSKAGIAVVQAITQADQLARERASEDACRRTDAHLTSLIKQSRPVTATEATQKSPAANQTQSAAPAPAQNRPVAKQSQSAQPPTAQNTPCPCGSGLKSDNCCAARASQGQKIAA